VIDSFSNKAETFALPVHQRDLIMFGEVWCKFDPDSTGYIPLTQIEEFMIQLSNSETQIFKHGKEEFAYNLYRENFIINMDIPTHNTFRSVMYYDVLLCLCRMACQQEFFRNEIARAKEQIQVLAKLRGQQLTENQLKNNANQVAMANAAVKF
jgi:hypothetical protein